MDTRIIKYYQGDLSEKEAEQLLREAYENPQLKEDLMSVQNISALAQLHPSFTDRAAGKAHLHAMKASRRNRRLRMATVSVMKYAATLLIGVVLASVLTHLGADKQQVAAMQELTVPQGQRAHITLPDGSSVWVNAGSVLRYPSAFDTERRVELSGEALFNVAKDKERPFIVTAKNTCIRALGTKFNVFGYREEPLSVSLMEGAVKVYEAENESKGVVLQPNEQLTVTANRFLVNEMDKDATAWQHGLFVFKSASMDDILRRLQLYYGVKIVVKSASILDFNYSGKFRQQDGVMDILRLVSKVHPFKTVWNEEKNEITLYN